MDFDVIDPSLVSFSNGFEDLATTPAVEEPTPQGPIDVTESQDAVEEPKSTPEKKRKRRSSSRIDESAPLNSSPPLSVQRKPHNPTFPPEDVQIANLLLAQLDTGSSTSPDWGAIAKDLKGLLRNARGVQSVWNKLFDELNHSGLAAAAKWSQSEDRVLRQAVAEYILSDAEGTFEDRNKVVARWILVRDRLSEKRQQSLGSLFKRWVEIKDVMIISEGDQAKPEEVGKRTLVRNGGTRRGLSYTEEEDSKIVQMKGEGKTHMQVALELGLLPASYVGRPVSITPKSSSPLAASSLPLRDAKVDSNPFPSAFSSTPPVSIDQVPFSPEDDRLILRLHTTFPGQFKKISRQMQPTRHKKEVRERYEELIAKRERSSSPDSSSDDNRPSRQTSRSNTFTSTKSRLQISTTGATEDEVIPSGQTEDSSLNAQTISHQALIAASNETPSVDRSHCSNQLRNTHESSRSPAPAPSIPPKRRLVDFSTETDPLPSPRLRKRRNASLQASQPRKVQSLGYEHLLGPALAALKGFQEYGERKGEDREKETESAGVKGKEVTPV